MLILNALIPSKSNESSMPVKEPIITPEELARLFHETYERLAPSYGYKTREASAVDCLLNAEVRSVMV
jgi:hypothetical protein